MATRGLRVAVVGATGALGSEVLAELDAASLPVAEIVAVASDASLGQDIEFQQHVYPVVSELPSLRGLDVVFLCAPAPASLEFARQALRAEVACIDCSGALAGSPEVPLRIAAFGPPPEGASQPLVATPPGGALAWALVLRPLAERAGLRRVAGTALEAASWRGRPGIESLYAESVALFNQQELPDPAVFPQPVAFDCVPALGEVAAGGETERETDLERALGRLLGADLPVAVTAIQVPTFVGHAAALSLQTASALDPKEAAALLAAAPRVEVWEPGAQPTVRAAAGRDRVLVARVRRDPSLEDGLRLWLACDLLRLAAANAVELAAARLRRD